jgi:hypothetical protein
MVEEFPCKGDFSQLASWKNSGASEASAASRSALAGDEIMSSGSNIASWKDSPSARFFIYIYISHLALLNLYIAALPRYPCRIVENNNLPTSTTEGNIPPTPGTEVLPHCQFTGNFSTIAAQGKGLRMASTDKSSKTELALKAKSEPAKHDFIKTPQSLIHIRHKISLLQYKYWILMLRELRRQFDAGIPPDEEGFRTMPMSVVRDAFGYSPNKTELWNDMLALKNETISYNFLNKDGGEMQYGAGFISEWKVHSSRVEFKFPSFIENVVRGLDEPKAIFHLLNWEIFNHFSGKYEAIIYKLCRDYRGVKKTPYFTIQKFRDYMGLVDGEYKEFRDLNKFVISSPVKTINQSEISDISVEVEFERQGRKVIGLRFLIEQRAQTMLPFPDTDLSHIFRFARVHIDPTMQRRYMALRSEEEIELCIQRANEYGEQQAKKGKEPNYGALYRSAITEGWHAQQIELKEKEEKAAKRRKATKQVLEQQEQAHAEEARESNERISALIARFRELQEEAQDEIREQFRATLAIPLRKSFDKQGESAPMVRALFADFFAKLEPAA